MNTGDSFYKKAVWRKRFIWKRPKKCELSNKLIWFRFAYEGVCMWTGPHDPVTEFRYHLCNEHFYWKLKS